MNPGCCGPGWAGRGGVGQSRENQFAKLIESSFVQFCCLERDVLYSNTGHRRTRGLGARTGCRGRASFPAALTLGQVNSHALPLSNQRGQALVVAAQVLKHRLPILF